MPLVSPCPLSLLIPPSDPFRLPFEQDTKLAEVCAAAPGGLTGFPTWVMPDGSQLVGEQSFEQLETALDKALAAAAAADAS
jgi:predicted DsbA family dithiol-disulfide isomerase